MALKVYVKKTGQIAIPMPESTVDFAGLKDGEYVAEFKRERNLKFHRKFFALVNFAYDHWDVDESVKNRKVFRKNLVMLAGYYDQCVTITGELIKEADSISFGRMDQVEFEALYSRVIDVVLQHVLKNYRREDLDRVLEQVLHFS